MKLNTPLSVRQCAAWLNATFIGNGDTLITGINEIHRVQPGDLTFVDHAKYYDKALHSQATTIIIDKAVAVPPGKAIIVSSAPFDDYNSIAKKYCVYPPSTQAISATANIGENCYFAPGVTIGNQVIIGDNCVLHSGVVVYDNCVIGNNCVIHANTVIGADAFYFKRKAEGYDKMYSCGRVVLGNNVELGALCTIDRGVSADTFIGDGTKCDNHVHIGHDSVVGKNCLFAAFVAIAGVTTIEDDVIIWGQAGVNKDLVIGRGTQILAQSGVGRSTQAGSKVFGSPAGDAREKMRELTLLKKLPFLFGNK